MGCSFILMKRTFASDLPISTKSKFLLFLPFFCQKKMQIVMGLPKKVNKIHYFPW